MKLLAAERIKLFSTRSPYFSIASIIVAVLLMTLPFSLFDNGEHATIGMSQTGMQFGMMIFMVLAALAVTTEYRFSTIRTTFLAAPRRTQVFAAKTVVVMVLGALLAAVLGPLAYLFTKLLATAPATPLTLDDAGDYRQIFGFVALFAIAGVVAIAVGTLVRQSAGAITILLVWSMLAEQLVSLIPNVGMTISNWLPFSAGGAFITEPADLDASLAMGGDMPSDVGNEILDASQSAPGPWTGLAVFAATALVLWLLAAVVMNRRDA